MAKIQDCVNNNVVVSARSITLKTDDGKTCGVIRGIESVYDAQPSHQFKYHTTLVKTGVDRNMWMSGLLDHILAYEGDLYFLVAPNSGKKALELAEAFRDSKGVTVIDCASVKYTTKRK